MSAEAVLAVAVPAAVAVGWLTKHIQNGRANGGAKADATAVHQSRVEKLLESIANHTSDIPLLRQVMEQHEDATRSARESVGELVADMKMRQRRRE